MKLGKDHHIHDIDSPYIDIASLPIGVHVVDSQAIAKEVLAVLAKHSIRICDINIVFEEVMAMVQRQPIDYKADDRSRSS